MPKESKIVKSNADYARQELPQICSEFGMPEEWATKRQASKYRLKKGRIYSQYTQEKRKSTVIR